MTAPVLDERLPVRIPGRALADLEAKYPQHVEDAPLGPSEAAKVLRAIKAEISIAERCQCCGDIRWPTADTNTQGDPA